MSRKKLVITAAVLAIVLLIGGLLAYFTDTTTEKTNVFTVGDKVDIELQETWTEGDGLGIATGETVEKAPYVQNIGANDAYVFMKVSIPKYYNKTANEGAGAWEEIYTLKYNGSTGINNDYWTLVDSNTTTANGTSADSVYVYAYDLSSTSGTMDVLAKQTGATPTNSQVLFDHVTFLDGKTSSFTFTINDNTAQGGDELSNGQSAPSVTTIDRQSTINITAYAIQANGLTQAGTSNAATTAEQIYALIAAELDTENETHSLINL